MEHNERWLEWAKELQFLSQVGLTYSKDAFEIERFKESEKYLLKRLVIRAGYL